VLFVIENRDELIKKDYLSGMENKAIAKKYGICISTLYRILKKLNLKKVRTWTDEQTNILKEKYSYEDWDILLDLLKPFNKDNIIHKAYDLKIKREIYGWTEEEVLILQNNYTTMSTKELVKLLPNKTEGSITTKAHKLGIRGREKWTEEDIKKIKEYYPIKDIKFLQEMFPSRSVKAIETMAIKILKLHKEDNYEDDIVKPKRKEMLINKLKEFANKLGRTPFRMEITNKNNMPNISTYNRNFGNFTNALKIAGLEVKHYLYGKKQTIYYSKNKDICCSIGELIITDFFIDNNITYIKEVEYSALINDNRCGTKRFDWVINNNVPVEYFGLAGQKKYDNKIENKLSICKDNNVNLMSIYQKDLTNLDLIFSDYLEYN
jgi:transposase